MPFTISRGDLAPDLEITIADNSDAAVFSGLSATNVHVVAERSGVKVIDDQADSVTPAADGKSALVKRAWASGDTDISGRLWVQVVVTWPNGDIQTFPEDSPLLVYIRRTAGDA